MKNDCTFACFPNCTSHLLHQIYRDKDTVFENHRKSLIQHCERSELPLHFEWTKWSILASFWKPEACSQIVLPDRSILKRQKLVENAKIKKRHFGHFGLFSNAVQMHIVWKYEEMSLKNAKIQIFVARFQTFRMIFKPYESKQYFTFCSTFLLASKCSTFC